MRAISHYERVFCVHKGMFLGVHSFESARSPFDDQGVCPRVWADAEEARLLLRVSRKEDGVPPEKRKIPIAGGGEADATLMPFQVGNESWNEYLLEDGTVLRVKLVATEIMRVDNAYNGDGDPVYLIKSQNVVASSVPEKLRKKKDQK